MANRYQLLGIRPAYQNDGTIANDLKQVAILRPVNGSRRITAVVAKADCESWDKCRAAIVQFLNKDGVNRLSEGDIAEPSSDIDWPWLRKAPVANEQTRYDSQNSLLRGNGGLDRSAGASYRQKASEFSRLTPQDQNAAYLESIGLGQQANFNNTDKEALFIWTDAARIASAKSRAAHKETDKTVLHHGEKEELNRKSDSAVNHSAIALNARGADKARHHHLEASKLHRALSGYHEIRGHDEAASAHYSAHLAHEKAAEAAHAGKREIAGVGFSYPSAPENGGLQTDNDKPADPMGDAGRAFESAKSAHTINGSTTSHDAAKKSEDALTKTRMAMDGQCSHDEACEYHDKAEQSHTEAAKTAKVPMLHLHAAEAHKDAIGSHQMMKDCNYSAANFSATVESAFDVSPVESSTDGDMVIRDCPVIFKTGDYPDKGFSLTLDEAKKITLPDFESRKASDPVRLRASHSTNPLNGKIGHIASLGVKDDGTLFGKVAIPKWLDEAFKGQKIPLSAGFDRVSKRLTHLALVSDARITGAAIAAFERHQADANGSSGEPAMSEQERQQYLALTPLGQLCLAAVNSDRRDRRNELRGRYAKR